MSVKFLYFKSPTCGPCRSMTPVVEEIRYVFASAVETTIVDVVDRPDVATRYGIRTVPAYVVLVDGVLVDQRAGSLPKKDLAAMLGAHL